MGTIPRHADVDVVVDASPTAVWEVVGDPRRTGEWSHECLEVAVRRRRRGAGRRRPLPRSQPGRAERLVAHLRDRRVRPGSRDQLAHHPDPAVYNDSTIWTITVEPDGDGHPHHAALRGGEARTGDGPVHLPVRARAPRPHATRSPTDLRRIGEVARGPEPRRRPGRFPRSHIEGISMRRFRSASLAALVLTALAGASVAAATPASAAKAKKPADDHRARHQRRRRGRARHRRAGRGAAQAEEHQGRRRRARHEPERQPAARPRPARSTTAAGDDRERLRGDRGARASRPTRHRRPRPARREAQRGDVGHQRGPEPRRRRRPLGHRRRGQDGRAARASPRWR